MSVEDRPRLVPEWAPQEAILLAWPEASGDFSPWLEAVERCYLAIAREVTKRERLLVLVKTATLGDRVARQLQAEGIDLAAVDLIELPYDDVWVRDTAPLTVASAHDAYYLDFRFNGWGGKYPHAADAQLAERLLAARRLGGAPRMPLDFVLEGGSIETDGRGTLITTSRCLLNPNRNPGRSKSEIEGLLLETLGVERVLWLDAGYAEGDDTDAHVDTLARFCSETVIAYTAAGNPEDSLASELADMERQLLAFTDVDGRPYQAVPLPIPGIIRAADGQRLPATYANFLILNEAVLVPAYGDPMDEVAQDRLAGVFQDRAICPIDCLPLIHQYGSLHCMTMQFPRLTNFQ